MTEISPAGAGPATAALRSGADAGQLTSAECSRAAASGAGHKSAAGTTCIYS